MNRYQFGTIFSILVIPVMFIGYEISFSIISKPIHVVFLNKLHLALITILFVVIAFAVFEGFRKILQRTKFSNMFISGGLTISFVLFGLYETLRLITLSEQTTDTLFTPPLFFVNNFVLGLALTIVITAIITFPVWYFLRRGR